ncbi:MAG: putative SOS response-associated peptidase YedK [Elusimicrobia bacterium]|nr:putative SOS response-associated peptidase YedK [Elusimicrobiota bacterium]
MIDVLRKRFLFEGPDIDLLPDYNIAPTDLACVVVQEGDKRFLKRMMFGLIPHWAKDPKIGLHCLNARAETVAEKPSFRDSFKNKRCLVLTDGFFEWAREGKKKTPYRVMMKDHAPYAMAGLWDRWKRPDGKEFETFSIVTTEPNQLVATIHDRMPVILGQENENLWLAPYVNDTKTVMPLLKSYAPDVMEMVAVSSAMNSSKNKSAECIQSLQP